jgi:hypothetical protein
VDAGEGPLSTVSGFVYLIYFVIFLCWNYRVLSNSRRMDASVQTVSPGWGVGSYFVPIVQFWVPAKALLQASRVSGTSGGKVLAWWIVSMGMLAIVLLYFGWMAWAAEDESVFDRITVFDHAITLVSVVVMVLEVAMVVEFNRAQRALANAGVSPA